MLYAIEGFLARLAASGHSDKLVLKGGVLLAAFLVRRPTRDVDLQAQAMPNDTESILDLVRSIAASPSATEAEGRTPAITGRARNDIRRCRWGSTGVAGS